MESKGLNSIQRVKDSIFTSGMKWLLINFYELFITIMIKILNLVSVNFDYYSSL